MPNCPRQNICNSNFPEYKANRHIGKSFAQCPFSTQCPEIRVRMMLRDYIFYNGGPDLLETSDGEFVVTNVDLAITNTLGYGRTDHTTISGNREGTDTYPTNSYIKYPTFSGTVYMYTSSSHGKYGYECAFNDCSYRQNNDGNRYFYS